MVRSTNWQVGKRKRERDSIWDWQSSQLKSLELKENEKDECEGLRHEIDCSVIEDIIRSLKSGRVNPHVIKFLAL